MSAYDECPVCGNTGDRCGAPRRCPRPVRLSTRPVAWRVKDFADGWIFFQDEAAANREAEQTGAAMQGLYVRDGM